MAVPDEGGLKDAAITGPRIDALLAWLQSQAMDRRRECQRPEQHTCDFSHQHVVCVVTQGPVEANKMVGHHLQDHSQATP